MNVYDMPEVQELRAITRAAFEKLRSNPPTLVLSQAASTLVFAQNELRQLRSEQVYHEESRRHELLKRGYLPPEDLSGADGGAPSLRPDNLSDEQCDELRRVPGSFNDMIRAVFKAGWDAREQLERRLR